MKCVMCKSPIPSLILITLLSASALADGLPGFRNSHDLSLSKAFAKHMDCAAEELVIIPSSMRQEYGETIYVTGVAKGCGKIMEFKKSNDQHYALRFIKESAKASETAPKSILTKFKKSKP